MLSSTRTVAAVLALGMLAFAGCARESDAPPSPPDSARRAGQIAELEARADRVKDSNDIKRLQRAYGYYFDQADWDQIADLFTADATYEAASEGVYVGQANIRE